MNTDFGDWIGPMLVKELRQGLKSRAFGLSFVLLQAALVLLITFSVLEYRNNPDAFKTQELSAYFWLVITVMLLVITPLRAFNDLAGERKANTLELLYMSGLTSWRIAVGKWSSLVFQSWLFVLALLPYAVLRYYFGSVQLAEEGLALVWMLLASALFTALGLAVSGLPNGVRLLCTGGVCILFLPLLIGVGSIVGGGARLFGVSSPFGTLDYASGAGLVLNVLLLIVAALCVAASTIAPPAENQQGRLRGLLVCGMVFAAVLGWVGVFEPDLQFFMVSFFAFLGMAVAGWHLATAPSPLHAHLEPFARFGKLGWLAGSWMQPGWPGALLFVLVLEGLMAAFTRSVSVKAAPPTMAVFAVLGAALLTPPLLRVLLWRRFKQPLVADFLVHCLSCAFVGGVAQVSKAALNSPGFLFFPPAALWAMFRGKGFIPNDFKGWFPLMFSLPLGLGFLGLLCSWKYWRRVAGLSAEVFAARRTRTPPKPAALP
jgi:ABC-type transport system involved in multi-copper enzyme maturation permease subunit